MTSSFDKITDAYATLRVHSKTLSVEELIQLAGFTPTETYTKGSLQTEGATPTPANAIVLSTERLVLDKDLNLHIRALGTRLPEGIFASRFNHEVVTIYLTIYWWTTEEIGFYLEPETLSILARVGVSPYFNYCIYPPVVDEDVVSD